MREAIDIATRLFEEGGVEAVSMRAVTREMSLSPTALYNYFADRSDLLRALWSRVLSQLHDQLEAAQQRATSARDGLRTLSEAFFDFYESRPNHWSLMFMTPQTVAPGMPVRWREDAVYVAYLGLVEQHIQALARELGGDVGRTRAAVDLWTCLLVGYLHCRLSNTRYPWHDLAALREQTLEAVDHAVCRCLNEVPVLG